MEYMPKSADVLHSSRTESGTVGHHSVHMTAPPLTHSLHNLVLSQNAGAIVVRCSIDGDSDERDENWSRYESRAFSLAASAIGSRSRFAAQCATYRRTNPPLLG